jgi:Fur family ferric uptake transcriptional regulator
MSRVQALKESAVRAGHPETIEDAVTLIRRNGGNVSGCRMFLLQSFFESDGHKTFDELASAVAKRRPGVLIPTITRNLDELERLGVIIRAHCRDGSATYHLAAGAHGHLVCNTCGVIVEAPEDIFAGLERSALSHFGFDVDPRHFAVPGQCERCRNE